MLRFDHEKYRVHSKFGRVAAQSPMHGNENLDEILQAREEIIRKTKETRANPSTIFADSIESLNVEVRAELNEATIKLQISRERNKSLPPCPTSLHDLEIKKMTMYCQKYMY